MTRQDFNLIAAIIKDLGLPREERDHAAKVFAYKLARVNPKFNIVRFLCACGMDSEYSTADLSVSFTEIADYIEEKL